MHIRAATLEDVSGIVSLVNSAYRGTGGWTGESHLIEGPRTQQEDVKELLREPDGILLTSWEEGELAGCVYLKKDGAKLYLGMLSVWPAKQAAGIGKQLMRAAEDHARAHDCETIRITVISVREELIAWYERHGFRRTGEAEPFHGGERFGTMKQPLELAVLERRVGIDAGYAPVNGIRMYYEMYGKGAMPLVLIHGGGSTIETSFGQLLPILARDRRVIAVELQAHGRTSDREGPESFQQDADDVAALLEHLGIGKADILGFSNGGSTALQIAIRHPEIVGKLISISGCYRRDGLVPGFFDSMPGATLDVMPAVLREAFLKVTPDSTKLMTMFQKDKQRMIDFADWSDEDLRSIKAPAMIISSDKDVIIPEHSVRMARLIAGARLVILPGFHGAVIGAMESGAGKGYADVTARLVEEFLEGE